MRRERSGDEDLRFADLRFARRIFLRSRWEPVRRLKVTFIQTLAVRH